MGADMNPFLLKISTSLGVGLGVRVMPARMRGSYAGLGLELAVKDESNESWVASLRGGYKVFEYDMYVRKRNQAKTAAVGCWTYPR